MTTDDVIRMVSVSDLYLDEANQQQPMHVLTPKELEHFANLVAAAEQERCIGIIYGQCGSDNVAQRTVDAIRSQS
jgi:hypothetical protein